MWVELIEHRSHNREPSDGGGALPGDAEDGEPDSPPQDINGSGGNDERGDHPPDAPDDSTTLDEHFEIGGVFLVRLLPVDPLDCRARAAGGHCLGERIPVGAVCRGGCAEGKASDLVVDATLRAAAPYQIRLGDAVDDPDSPLRIEPWDIREKVRETKTGRLGLFVEDASGSMGAQQRMAAVKRAILSLLLDAYQRRDRVGLIAFRGAGAQVLLPPTSRVDLAHARLREMPTGGRTPLGRGLLLALR